MTCQILTRRAGQPNAHWVRYTSPLERKHHRAQPALALPLRTLLLAGRPRPPRRFALVSYSWKPAGLELCRWNLVGLGKHERLGFSESLNVSLAELASEARALVATERSARHREVLVDL
eukprot:COSAG02_NODE_5663_length_4144_cov_59.133251_5_plen_119_part_00